MVPLHGKALAGRRRIDRGAQGHDGTHALTGLEPGDAPQAADLFVLSFQHRNALMAAAGQAGWHPIGARRSGDLSRRFVASGAHLALVDTRDALDEALGAIRALADAAQANAAGLLAIVSRDDVHHLGDVFAAGATHYVLAPFDGAELGQALRFAARHAERIAGGVDRTGLAAADTLGWRWADGQISLSPALAQRIGAAARRLPLSRAYRLLRPADRAGARAARRRLAAGHATTAFTHLLPGGERVAQQLTAGATGVSGLIELLRPGGGESAHRDPLTDLPDEHAARRWLTRAVGGGTRPGVLIVGLSRLQTVNSLYGRAGGDVLLQAAARRIERAVQDASGGRAWLARLAGADLFIGVPRARRAELEAVAEAITSTVGAETERHPMLLGVDIGGAIAAADEAAGVLLRRAHIALVDARAEPGSGPRIVVPGHEAATPRLPRLAEDLRRALTSGEIELVFQPQVRMADGRISGVEALARWRHPEFGALGADLLFGAAERAGLSERVSAHVQTRALELAAAWPTDLATLRLSVNVTARDIARPGFATAFLEMLASSGFEAARTTVEITEDALIEDLPAAAAALTRLREGGCAVALDDFGTGYSSLAYLNALPIDWLKLDRCLSQGITGGARDRIVVRSVIDLARSLGLEVIAEGVETEEQRALLAAEGCASFQGFLCSGPVATAALVELVRAHV